jgi:ferrochelatase
MKTGVILVNFGEPARATLDYVAPFLERIFFQNANLESGDPQARRKRSQELAAARAPSLVEEYEQIGGSPLNPQADAQAEAVQGILRKRGHDAMVYSAFQYTSPSVEAMVSRAEEQGCERLLGLPVYPLCGHSTNVLALREFRQSAEEHGYADRVLEVGGWHLHPDFMPMWADHIRRFVADRGLRLSSGETELVFSIHGTPVKYLEAGNRYDRYVHEACRAVAERLGVSRYHMGYQNHTNRPIQWTEPDVDTVVSALSGQAEGVLIVPIAFMHEQSETLVELDSELKGVATEAGLRFDRVPVPHDDPRFPAILADLVESRLTEATPKGGPDAASARGAATATTLDWRQCICRGEGGKARCLNGLRLHGTVELGRQS